MFLLWHPSLTAINLSYTFPILETSATALCGTTGKCIIAIAIGFVPFQDRVVGPLPNGRTPLLMGVILTITSPGMILQVDFAGTLAEGVRIPDRKSENRHRLKSAKWYTGCVSVSMSFGRWVSFSIGWCLGSMLIFRGSSFLLFL